MQNGKEGMLLSEGLNHGAKWSRGILQDLCPLGMKTFRTWRPSSQAEYSVMQWKIVTISNVSHSLPPFEAHIHICRCFCRMLKAMKRRHHQQRLFLSLRLWRHPALGVTKFEGKFQNSKTKRTIVLMKNVEFTSHSK